MVSQPRTQKKIIEWQNTLDMHLEWDFGQNIIHCVVKVSRHHFISFREEKNNYSWQQSVSWRYSLCSVDPIKHQKPLYFGTRPKFKLRDREVSNTQTLGNRDSGFGWVCAQLDSHVAPLFLNMLWRHLPTSLGRGRNGRGKNYYPPVKYWWLTRRWGSKWGLSRRFGSRQTINKILSRTPWVALLWW